MYIFEIYISGFKSLEGLNSKETINVGGMSNETALYSLFTSIFVHGSYTHLLTNLILFIAVGIYVHKYFGNKIYISTFFLSGILGNILTKFASDNVTGGMSGCIYGLVALAVFSSFDKSSELYESRWLSVAATSVLVLTTFMFPNVNVYSHTVGFVTGCFIYCIYSAYIKEKEVHLYEKS
ncbi:rhomboid family intramembrane serine protease [Staphylococcus shinii]|uniref:rhomboid family intramembrane serine protease n=1 Tax=Staphylococcus shinii TaxID=2912228 RepID=UPI003F577C23